jgi:DNA-binding NtrC family response regulator
VDDEADLRDLLVEALQDQGYAAEGAEGGAQALALVRQRHFPVVFTDLNMPGGLSGLELLRAIREEDPQTMGILMTGYATTESAIQALKRGAYDFIQKPFKLAEIEASLERALEHYRLRRENEEYQQNLERMVETSRTTSSGSSRASSTPPSRPSSRGIPAPQAIPVAWRT